MRGERKGSQGEPFFIEGAFFLLTSEETFWAGKRKDGIQDMLGPMSSIETHSGYEEVSEYQIAGVGLVRISERSRQNLETFISLEREKVNQYRVVVELKPILLPPHRLFSGRSYFSIYLRDEHGHRSEKPVVDQSLYSVGGKNVLPWIEIGNYWPEVAFKEQKAVREKYNIANSDTQWKLFKLLGDLIPPGGHMMVPYELDDNVLSRMTFAALQKNIPMVATPIGFLLFRIGFTIPFRDWYIAEGGHEGPSKLHFEKPLTDQRAREVSGEIMRELTVFIDSFPERQDVELVRSCKKNACKIRDLIRENHR
jgi:hypothetical protein